MGRKTKHQKRYQDSGRPQKITPEVLAKLEEAFSFAMPDVEACLFAGIHPATLYRYQERNPKFSERKEALKLNPNLTARKTIVAALSNANDAWKWMERKDPDFRPSSKVEHSGKIQTESAPMTDAEMAAVKAYEEAYAQQIREETNKMP